VAFIYRMVTAGRDLAIVVGAEDAATELSHRPERVERRNSEFD